MRSRLALVAVTAIALLAGVVVDVGAVGSMHVWSTPSDLGVAAGVVAVSSAVSTNGDAILVSQDGLRIQASISRSGSWTSPILLSAPNEQTHSMEVATVADPAGRLYVTWVGIDQTTHVASIRVAVSQPGSTAIDQNVRLLGDDYDVVGPPAIAVDGAGHLIVAAIVSSDGGTTRSAAFTRCDFTGTPVCEEATVVAGAASPVVLVLQPTPDLTTVVWATTGSIEAVDYGIAGPGAPFAVGSMVPGQLQLRGWAGNGRTLVQWDDGVSRSLAIRAGSVWGAPFGVSEWITDIAFAPDGTMLELRLSGPMALSVVTTTDGIIDDDVQQLTAAVDPWFLPPTIRVASDGSAVALWGTQTSNSVMSAVRVAGVWTELASIGTFQTCGGQPFLARGDGGRAIASWISTLQGPPMLVAEMILATTTTTSTTTTTIADLAPIFTC